MNPTRYGSTPSVSDEGYVRHTRLLVPVRIRDDMLAEEESQNSKVPGHPITEFAADHDLPVSEHADGPPIEAKSRRRPRNAVKIFSEEALATLIANIRARWADRDQRTSVEARLTAAKKMGPYRKRINPDQRSLGLLEKLGMDCPNFSEVEEFLKGEIRTGMLARKPFQPTPILLLGPPGVGKSYFAARLKDIYRTSICRLQMESAETASGIGGSSSHWINTRPGLVFDALVDGAYANPILFLDEIDKAPVRETGQSALATLYALLEQESARKYKDQSISDLELDASHIIWICTANRVDTIPAPILSRMRVFDIPAPTTEQAVLIIERLYLEIISSLRVPASFNAPPIDALRKVLSASPRTAKQVLRAAVGRAIAEGAEKVERKHVDIPSIPPSTAKPPPQVVLVIKETPSTDEPKQILH